MEAQVASALQACQAAVSAGEFATAVAGYHLCLQHFPRCGTSYEVRRAFCWAFRLPSCTSHSLMPVVVCRPCLQVQERFAEAVAARAEQLQGAAKLAEAATLFVCRKAACV